MIYGATAQETHLDVLKRNRKKKRDAPGRNLSRLMELGAGSRDPSLSEKVWRKDFYMGGGVLGRAAHV